MVSSHDRKGSTYCQELQSYQLNEKKEKNTHMNGTINQSSFRRQDGNNVTVCESQSLE